MIHTWTEVGNTERHGVLHNSAVRLFDTHSSVFPADVRWQPPTISPSSNVICGINKPCDD